MGFILHDCNSYMRLVFCDINDLAGFLLKKVKVTITEPYSSED